MRHKHVFVLSLLFALTIAPSVSAAPMILPISTPGFAAALLDKLEEISTQVLWAFVDQAPEGTDSQVTEPEGPSGATKARSHADPDG